LLIAILATFGTQASAQSHDSSRYDMMTAPQDKDNSVITTAPRFHNNRTDTVIILDKRTGVLWSLDEPSATIVYLGRIYPMGSLRGPIARIIQVDPKEKR
jgi:hypothetical protein